MDKNDSGVGAFISGMRNTKLTSQFVSKLKNNIIYKFRDKEVLITGLEDKF